MEISLGPRRIQIPFQFISYYTYKVYIIGNSYDTFFHDTKDVSTSGDGGGRRAIIHLGGFVDDVAASGQALR